MKKSNSDMIRNKILSDKFLSFIYEMSEFDIDEMNEVTLTTFNKDIDDIDNPIIVRGLWEKGLNRKLSSIFINCIKNPDAYVELHKNGYITLHTDLNDNIVIDVLDFFVNDYNFEKTDIDNNIREYTFYYSIIDESDDYYPILIKGRFDLDISTMYIENDIDTDIIEELSSDDVCHYEIDFNVTNKVFINKYINKDYNDNDQGNIISNEVKLLKKIFNSIDNDKINSIIDCRTTTDTKLVIE